MKHLTPDDLILHFDSALRTLSGSLPSRRPNPADDVAESELTREEQKQSGRLMRVNHCGEICAQALYLGQSVTSDNPATRASMQKAAEEEADHLAWCDQRISELGTHRSYLNPAFWTMSFAGGLVSGLIGNRFNLGFVAATEEQVVTHLEGHLEELPENDQRSRSILEQMKSDEDHHRTTALENGGADFPRPVKAAMTLLSRVMTRTTYWV